MGLMILSLSWSILKFESVISNKSEETLSNSFTLNCFVIPVGWVSFFSEDTTPNILTFLVDSFSKEICGLFNRILFRLHIAIPPLNVMRIESASNLSAKEDRSCIILKLLLEFLDLL